MRILLDTNILYWLLYEKKRLPKAAKDFMARAEHIFVSSATIWEIAIKVRIGKLNADVDQVIHEVYSRPFQPLPVQFIHARQVADLHLYHSDPFDRLLIAQAMTEQFHLLTADPKLKQYSNLVLLV